MNEYSPNEPPLTPIRTLLVDDHDFFRQAVAHMLVPHNGFQVVGEAEDGFEAIEKARALKPDLILMDMSMPRCDGLEATRRIRRELPNAIILIFTVAPQDKRVVQALASGAQGYLQKNATKKQLLESLRQAMTGTLKPKY